MGDSLYPYVVITNKEVKDLYCDFCFQEKLGKAILIYYGEVGDTIGYICKNCLVKMLNMLEDN